MISYEEVMAEDLILAGRWCQSTTTNASRKIMIRNIGFMMFLCSAGCAAENPSQDLCPLDNLGIQKQTR